MTKNTRNDNGGVKRVLGQLAAEKKKAGMAICLVAVMAFMWTKVLTKEGPQGAQATPAGGQKELDKRIDDPVKIDYLELPEVPGRNDLISRDFFASAGWQDFKTDDEGNNTGELENANVTPADLSEEIVNRVTPLLKLQAIEGGNNRRAFINDKVMLTTETLIVTDGIDMYECEVIEIRRKSVVVRCREAEIVLKIVQTTDEDG